MGNRTPCRIGFIFPAHLRRLRFLFRHLFSFLSGLGQTDRNSLFPTLDPTAFASRAAFRLAPLVAVHFVLDLFAGALGVFALLSHSVVPSQPPEYPPMMGRISPVM